MLCVKCKKINFQAFGEPIFDFFFNFTNLNFSVKKFTAEYLEKKLKSEGKAKVWFSIEIFFNLVTGYSREVSTSPNNWND